MKIYVIRHNETEHNANKIHSGWADVPLSKKGKKQAELLSKRLKRELADNKNIYIYSSPLTRATQTAKKIAKSLNANFVISNDLIEWKRFPDSFSGKRKKDFPKRIYNLILKEGVKANWRLEGIESFIEVKTRARNVFKSFKKYQDNNIIILVTHGDFGRLLIAHAMFGETLRQPKQFEKFKIWLENSSISIIEIDDKHSQCIIQTIGDFSHLN